MSQRENLVLAHLSAIMTFVAALLTLVAVSLNAAGGPSPHYYLAHLSVVLLNIVILYFWIIFGSRGGIIFLAFALLAILYLSWRLGDPSALVFALSFSATSLIGFFYQQKADDQERAFGIKIEKMDGETNVLADAINKKKVDIDAQRKKIERYATLKEVAEVLSTTLSLDEIAALVVDSSMRIIGKADRGLLFLVNNDSQELALHTSRIRAKMPKIKDKKGDLFDHWVLKQRKPLLIEDTDRDFRFSQIDLVEARHYFCSLISVAIIVENKVVGVLRLDSMKEFSYNQDDLRLLDIIADLAAVAAENNRLFRQTEDLAIKDGLTDLVVQRYFKERLFEETKRAARAKSVFSLLIVDIDFFKKYNDKYGHIAGDIVLRYLAGILKGVAREGDIVARYGGEEFALILLGRDKAQAIKEAEAVRVRIESEPLMLRREKASLTVSIGVSNFPSDSLLAEDLLKKADDRLYKAKRSGRNRVNG